MDRTEMRAALETQLEQAVSPWDKLPILLELTREPTRSDFDAAHRYAQEALAMARELNDPFWIACSLRAIGLSLLRGKNYAKSLQHLQKGARIFQRIDRPDMQAQTELSIARVYVFMGKFDEAVILLRRNMPAFESMQNPYYRFRALRYLGEIFCKIGEHSKGCELYQQALGIAGQEGMEEETAFLYQDLAFVYRHLQDFKQQRSYLLQALEIHKRTERKDGTANATANLASMYIEQGQFARAGTYVRQSRRLYQELGFTANEAMAWGKQGLIYYHQGNPAKAFRCLRNGLSLARMCDNLVIRAKLYEHLGILLLKEGRTAQALKAMRKALRIITTSGYGQVHHEIHWNLAEAYEKFGDPVNALKHSRESIRIQQEHLSMQEVLETGRVIMRAKIKEIAEQLSLERLRKHSLSEILQQKQADLVALTRRLAEQKDRSEPHHSIDGNYTSTAYRQEENWNTFARQFHQVHHNFYTDLIKYYPQLTPTEVKVCSLIRIGLSSKEIAAILDISKRTVDSHREHIHKKLNISTRLADFITAL